MTTYFVLAGDEPWDTINGVWAVLKEKDHPIKQVHLLGEEDEYIKVKEDIEKMLVHYGIEADINTKVISGDEASKKIEEILNKTEEEEVVLDITGGTKYLSADILVNSQMANFTNIFCLFYSDDEHMERPYPVIEKTKLELRDLKRKSRSDKR
ncbi:MAG: hypothetical protein ACLFNY_06525 [Candidatus Aenigmatarchaeota archaeon]